MKARALLLVALLTTAACGGQTSLSADDLTSEERQLRSLVEEIGLVRETIDARHTTRAFIRGHGRHLLQTAVEHAKKLAVARTTPELQPRLDRLARQFAALALQP